jgi:YidC/Oxa1 family membrane protein insertase
MNSEDIRNLFLAAALSLLVMVGWQYFYAGPLSQREHQAQTQANVTAPASEAQPGATPAAPSAALPGAAIPPGAPATAGVETVSQALAASPRVIIDTPSIGGSIDLKGGRIDDIILKDYHETVDPKSPNVRLFSPPGAPDAYCQPHRGQDAESRHRLDC